MKSTLLAGVLLILIGTPATLFFLSAPAAVEIDPTPTVIGPSSQFTVKVNAPHGIRILQLSLDQGTARTQAGLQKESNRWLFWRSRQAPAAYQIKIGADPKLGFKGGPATLTVQVTSNDFRGQMTSRGFDVVVNLDPPTITADSEQHYITQGGAELVTFRVAGYWTEAGVRLGRYRFRSFPRPGAKSPNERFCLFAWPWDVPATEQAVVYASNSAGAEAASPFWQKVKPKQWRRRAIELTDGFISKVVGELDPQGAGDPVERFLRINRQMRIENNRLLAGLRLQTSEQMLWTPPFKQMANTQVESLFADVRSYTYRGKKVDEQVHLGFDLSRVARTPAEAANGGKVVFAGPLGIYGNCVVVDHGYGLQSIYAHLSEISVKPGDSVTRDQSLGRTGATGMAAGDHLHFSMQIDGVQVNPIEWWDAKWIENRILSKLSATGPTASSEGR